MRTHHALCCAATLLLVAACPALAGGQTKGDVHVSRIQSRPTAEPIPVLKYRLATTVLDQTEGNAAQTYKKLMTNLPANWGELRMQIHTLLDLPSDQTPVAEVRKLLTSLPMAEIRRASRMERCDWNYHLRVDAIQIQLPALNILHHFAKAAALQARVHAMEGDFPAAVDSLQTAFAVARHTAKPPILIHRLVGEAIVKTMLHEIETMLALPDAPNFYWALTALPRPLITYASAIDFERDVAYTHIPLLRSGKREKMSDQQWDEQMKEYADFIAMVQNMIAKDEFEVPKPLTLSVLCLKDYPKAKEYLSETGLTDEQIEAMPVVKAVGIYVFDEYDRWCDKLVAWTAVPYWQAYPHLRQTDHDIRQASRTIRPLLLIPSFARAAHRIAGMERHIAALRTIEAARMYAAAHDGRPPASLADITAVPVPINPMTGQAFGYEVAGQSFTLTAATAEDDRPRDIRRYQVNLQTKE